MEDYKRNVSKIKALSIVTAHDQDVKDFICEMGDKSSYSLQAIRDWLGY